MERVGYGRSGECHGKLSKSDSSMNHIKLYRSSSCDALFVSDNDITSSLKPVVYRTEYVDGGDDDVDWNPSTPASMNGSNTGRFREAVRCG